MVELWRVSFDDKRHAEVDHHHFSWGSMYKAEVSDLVEALDGKRIEHYCVMHQGRVWAYPDLTECPFQRYQRANLGQPAETPCDIQPVAVVPLGEDA